MARKRAVVGVVFCVTVDKLVARSHNCYGLLSKRADSPGALRDEIRSSLRRRGGRGR